VSAVTYTAEFAGGARAELSVDHTGAGVSCSWAHGPPFHLRGQARRRFLQAYRAWRNDSLQDYTRRTGVRILVLETDVAETPGERA
jgi:hypothetical protein